MTFKELRIEKRILKAIAEMGFESPMPVQEEVSQGTLALLADQGIYLVDLLNKPRPISPEYLFIPLRLEDTGNEVIAAFLLQSIKFAVTTRRNDAKASGYTQKSSPHCGRSF